MNPLVQVGGALLAFVLWSGGIAWLSYNRGSDDRANYEMTLDLAQAKADLAESQRQVAQAQQAGEKHEQVKTEIRYVNRTITETVTVPPDADPFIPVWFGRLLDRYASQNPTADAYPGKSDGDTSTTRLSQSRSVLEQWSREYYVCRAQIIAINELRPVLPQAE